MAGHDGNSRRSATLRPGIRNRTSAWTRVLLHRECRCPRKQSTNATGGQSTRSRTGASLRGRDISTPTAGPNADRNARSRISRIGTMAGTPPASPRALTTEMREPSWCSDGSMPPERIPKSVKSLFRSALGPRGPGAGGMPAGRRPAKETRRSRAPWPPGARRRTAPDRAARSRFASDSRTTGRPAAVTMA